MLTLIFLSNLGMGGTALGEEKDVANSAGMRPTATEIFDNLEFEVDYEGGTNAIYFGKAVPGTATSEAGWSIKKFTWDSNNNPTEGKWADRQDSFNKIWDSRATYTYS